jgi:hypothetical protein
MKLECPQIMEGAVLKFEFFSVFIRIYSGNRKNQVHIEDNKQATNIQKVPIFSHKLEGITKSS